MREVQLLDFQQPPPGFEVGPLGWRSNRFFADAEPDSEPEPQPESSPYAFSQKCGPWVKLWRRPTDREQALAAAWARYKEENDPPGMWVEANTETTAIWCWGCTGSGYLGWVDDEVSLASLASSIPPGLAKARAAAWAWYERRAALAPLGMWPACLAWSHAQVDKAEHAKTTADGILGPYAAVAGAQVRAAMATRIDDAGRYYTWSWPSDRHFSWRGWRLAVSGDGGRYTGRHHPTRARCSCGCFGPPCDSDRLGRVIMAELRRLGFWTGRDRDSARHGHCLVHSHRQAARRALRARIHWYPAGAEVCFYVDANREYPAGPSFASYPERAASYLDRKLFEFVRAALNRVLEEAGYRDRTEPTIDEPRQRILWKQLMSGHWSPKVGLRPTPSYRHTTQDGVPIVEGMRVQFYGHGRGGVLREGFAFCGLNDSWHVTCGDTDIVCSSAELFSWRPGRPRRWTPLRVQLTRVRDALGQAVKAEDFERAATLKRVRDRLQQSAEAPTSPTEKRSR